MDDDEALSFRCSPTVTAKLISLLPAAVVKRLDDAGLRQMREFKLDGIGSRVILSQLLKRTVVDEENNRIQIIIKEGQSLWIDTNIVQFILDMPTGSDKALPVAESELVEAEYMKLYEALLYVKKKTADTAGTAGTVVTEEQPGTAGIAGTVVTEEQPNRDTEDQPSSETEEQTRNETREHASNETADQHTGGQPSQQIAVSCRYAKEARQVFTKKNIEALFQKCEEDDVKRLTTTDMLTRLYMTVLLDELLLASSSSYITSALLKNVYQLEKLKDVDWPYIVYDCLKKSCSGEKTKNRGGCVIVHMVLFVDCIKGNHLEVGQSGRINLYTERMINNLVNERGKTGVPGKKAKPFRSFELQKWEESVYKNFKVGLDNSENDICTVYKKNVTDMARDIVVDIDGCCIASCTFADCLKEDGYMCREMLYLVCDLLLEDSEDTVVLGFSAVKILLGKGTSACGKKELACGEKELASAKLKNATEIYVPVVSDGHTSLVVVSHTASKTYILDSWPEYHEEARATLLSNLQAHLKGLNSIDTSEYALETPQVQRQGNDCDAFIHVLLYVRGFKTMQIYDINKEKVLDFRMQITRDLLYHKRNRRSPNHRFVEEREVIVTSDADITHEDEEGEDTVTTRGTDQETYTDERTEGTGKEGPSAEETLSEDRQLDHPTRKADKETRLARSKKRKTDNADGDSDVSFGKSPVGKVMKRRIAPSFGKQKFEPHHTLSPNTCLEIYEVIKSKDDNTVVFNGGNNSITAGELIQFLEKGGNDPKIVNAFIHCLKFDDERKGYSRLRIIISAHDLSDEKIVDVIKKEIQQVGKPDKLRFIFCHTVHKEECMVLLVDMLSKDMVTICHSSNTALPSSECECIGKAYAKHVKEAFGNRSPISEADKSRVSSVSFHADRKESALGSIICLEQYDGSETPNTLQNDGEGYKALKLAHLLIHGENSIKFEEVTAIVDEGKNKKTRKKNSAR